MLHDIAVIDLYLGVLWLSSIIEQNLFSDFSKDTVDIAPLRYVTLLTH